MVLESIAFAPNLIHALLRISCSRKAKNTHNPLIFLRKWLLIRVLRVPKSLKIMQARFL